MLHKYLPPVFKVLIAVRRKLSRATYEEKKKEAIDFHLCASMHFQKQYMTLLPFEAFIWGNKEEPCN